jgi:hypothetical protein
MKQPDLSLPLPLPMSSRTKFASHEKQIIEVQEEHTDHKARPDHPKEGSLFARGNQVYIFP